MLSLIRYGLLCVLGGEVAYLLCILGGYLHLRTARGMELHDALFVPIISPAALYRNSSIAPPMLTRG